MDGGQADADPAQGCLVGQGDNKCPEDVPPVWASQPSSPSAAPSVTYHGGTTIQTVDIHLQAPKIFGMPSSCPILLICQLFPSPVRGGRIPAGSATPEPAPSSCVEDEAVAAAPSCGTWQMEKLGPETSRDWEPPGEVWTKTSQAPPGQPCSGSALSMFSMPWVCFFFLTWNEPNTPSFA